MFKSGRNSVRSMVDLRGWLEFSRKLGRALPYNFFRIVEPLFFQPNPSPKEAHPLACLSRSPSDMYGHLMTLYMLSVEMKLRTIVELGTRNGVSTTAFLYAAKEIGGHVYSFDIDPSVEARMTVVKSGLQSYWTFTQANDLLAEWDSPINHLFIDTTHTLVQTLAELQKYEKHVSRGGIITMHDIVRHPGVNEALRRFVEERKDLRVYRYYNNNGLAVIFKTNP